jgi:ribosome-associated protein
MDEDDFISKTRRKRQMTELQVLGADLVKLSAEQLARIDMPENLRDAILECKRFNKHEAIRRQMQYIGRIMRDIDAAAIAEQLGAMHAPSRKQTALFHTAEKWRAEMLATDSAVDRFAAEFPAADAAKLRTIIGAAHEERAHDKPPRHFRELFHVLNAIIQEQAKKPS